MNNPVFLGRDPCLRRATKVVATEVGQVRQTVTTTKFGDQYVGHRSGSSFRDRNKHQPSHRDSTDGGHRTKTTASRHSKARAVLRRYRGEEADNSRNRPQQVHPTDTIHHKNRSVLKMTTRSLRSRRALEETEGANAINVESEIPVMSGGER